MIGAGKRMQLNYWTCLIGCLFVQDSSAQESLGTWNILNLNARVSDKIGVFGEAQLRSLLLYSDYHYYEVKGGAWWRMNEQVTFLGGAGRYDTYSAGGNFESPRLNREIRTWGQANLKNSMGRWIIEHRYRAEQRFTDNGYRNRFRYRLACTYLLNSSKISTGTLFVNAWNETFFTNLAPYFERNRIFAGMGYVFSESLMIHLGYVHQFDYKLTDEIGRDFVQIGFNFSQDWRRSKTVQNETE